MANLLSFAASTAAAAGAVLCLILGVMWLVLLIRTRAKLRAIENSMGRKQTKSDKPEE